MLVVLVVFLINLVSCDARRHVCINKYWVFSVALFVIAADKNQVY